MNTVLPLFSRSSAFLITAFFAPGAAAGAPVIPAGTPVEVPSLLEITVRPYAWLAGVEGTIGVRGHTAETDTSFDDIIKNLEMTAALQAEVRHDSWMLLLDGMYLKTSADGETSGPLLSGIHVEVEQIMAEASIGYRLWESGKGFVDIFAGARYMSLGADLGFDMDSAGVESFSRNLAAEAVSRVDTVARDSVAENLPKLKSRAVAAAESALLQHADKVLADHPNLPSTWKILKRRNAQVSEAVRELAGARLAELQASARTARNEVSAAEARLRDRAHQASARAEKRLAHRIEEAVKETIPDQVSGSRNWVDPIIGIRARYHLSSQFYAAARADIGGFGVSSDLAWQAYAGLGWQCAENIILELGWRCLQMDYTSGGFTYDTMTSGIFVGASIRF